MTVAEHVALAGQVAAKRRASAAAGSDVLERVCLSQKSAALAADLSHGDKRKLELAMLLASGAERLLLLDEPMAGVASGDVPGLVEVIRALHRDEGRTVLMVEHHMEVLLGLADRVAVMHHGALLAIDTPERIMADARVQEAYVGNAL
jgi:branched-chain amino acid transport system ATP-binding protein